VQIVLALTSLLTMATKEMAAPTTTGETKKKNKSASRRKAA
jgi:hypothetical protein